MQFLLLQIRARNTPGNKTMFAQSLNAQHTSVIEQINNLRPLMKPTSPRTPVRFLDSGLDPLLGISASLLGQKI